jgi:hypothetical protein
MGQHKWLRNAEKIRYAQQTGKYLSGSDFGEGMTRAALRLVLIRAANRARLRDAVFPRSSRQQNRSYFIRGR